MIDAEGTGGTATLSIGERCVGTMRLEETFEHFVAFQSLDIDADRLSPVRADPKGEFPYERHLARME